MPGSKTEQGVRYIMIAQGLGIALVILTLVGVLLLIIGVLAIASSGGTTSLAMLGVGLGVAILFAGTLCVVSLIILVMEIIGIVYLMMGKAEFPHPHGQKVTMGLVLVIIGVVLSLVGSFVPFVSPLASVLSGLGFVFFIIEIARPFEKRYLWTGFVLMIMGEATRFGATVAEMLHVSSTISISISLCAALVMMCASVITFIAYYRTYQALKSGIIKPEPPAPSLYPFYYGGQPTAPPYQGTAYSQPSQYDTQATPAEGTPSPEVPRVQPVIQVLPSKPPPVKGEPAGPDNASRAKALLIECPSCTHRFRIPADAKELECPKCGVKGEM